VRLSQHNSHNHLHKLHVAKHVCCQLNGLVEAVLTPCSTAGTQAAAGRQRWAPWLDTENEMLMELLKTGQANL
jgi:hypothetical protein